MDDARGFLHDGHGLDYVLLDLEIPSPYGKPPLVQHGLNLLARIPHGESAAKPYRTAITGLRSVGGSSHSAAMLRSAPVAKPCNDSTLRLFATIPHEESGLALANEVDADLPVVVITAHGRDSSDLPAEIMRHGRAFDYIRKPFPRPGEPHRTLEAAAREAHDKRLHALDANRLVATPFAGGC